MDDDERDGLLGEDNGIDPEEDNYPDLGDEQNDVDLL